MPRSANVARIASEVSGDGGTGVPNGITTWIAHVVADAALAQVLVEQDRRLARRRRALERGAAHADDRRARSEGREHVAQASAPATE